jgi:hypothetical protein
MTPTSNGRLESFRMSCSSLLVRRAVMTRFIAGYRLAGTLPALIGPAAAQDTAAVGSRSDAITDVRQPC